MLVGAVLALDQPAAAAARRSTPTGQALMQSQRLAKSAPQALVRQRRRPSPRCSDSRDVLARNVRALKSGDGDAPAAPAALQDQLDPLLPLVDRCRAATPPSCIAPAEGADRRSARRCAAHQHASAATCCETGRDGRRR
ncbi:MAG: type IV pili methyl-accepting chemotaxis transducer N-terminal domain-containing protein [Comamonadaceae bacterium]|nr:type IV pili methyl-accepting chemotaxis transducer N-terminal domain-containing protein [Comamonadaceae bacterium]